MATALKLNGPLYSEFPARLAPGGSPLYSDKDQQCIIGTVEKLLTTTTTGDRPGMLLGKVQSGKTKTFMAIMALGFDNGFDITVILTKGTKALARQTEQRVRQEFDSAIKRDLVDVFDILSVPDGLTEWELEKKLIFVAKKQTDNLDRLHELLINTYPGLQKRRILMIDDEADNASIGYGLDKQEQLFLRRISGQIDKLRRDLANVSFLQVTATPYALYLQPENEPIQGKDFKPVRPAFTKLVPEHPAYVGGKFYFEDSKIAGSAASCVYVPVDVDELTVLKREDRRAFKKEECLTSPRIFGLRTALLNFVTGGCIRRIQASKYAQIPPKFSFLFHTEAGRDAHHWQTTVVSLLVEKLKSAAIESPEILHPMIESAYANLRVSIAAAGMDLPPLAEVTAKVLNAFQKGEIMVSTVNSDRDIATLLDESGQLRLRNPLNLFIGGQILDRGITIANLIGFYYGRNPGRFQQDTVLQHSRMYGARPAADCAVTRFYTTPQIHEVMAQMHEFDTALRERIEKEGGDQAVTFLGLDEKGRITNCNPNKILAASTTTLRPGKRLAPIGFQTDCMTRLKPVTEAIDKLLAGHMPIPASGATPAPIEVPLAVALQIIDLLAPTIFPESGFERRWIPAEYKAALSHLSNHAQNPANRGTVVILVRTGRLRKRQPGGSDSPLDTPDNPRVDTDPARAAGTDMPVLMLLKQEGRKSDGWSDCPFWWPVLLAPTNTRPVLFAHSK